MATQSDPIADVTEKCDTVGRKPFKNFATPGWRISLRSYVQQYEQCDRPTPHQVAVEILIESPDPEDAAFSREPYRVRECEVCGATEKIRMNNA